MLTRLGLKPRDDRFFAFFNDLAQASCEGAGVLKSYFEHQTEPNDYLNKLLEIEEKGDQILATVMEQINSSFVTPFDREDILLLSREINNVLDHTKGTMEKIFIYKAGQTDDPHIFQLVSVLEEACKEIKIAVHKLPNVRTQNTEIIRSCNIIRDFENEGDNLYRAGMALLFENTENVINIIKWKEIYEHLETTIDYCENVSNLLKGIAVKYV
ncbi:MAG TPA: DUF47 family protein [Syntrophomonadaceae bacterium]|nr:DUF47 family protein [Syntrophomonadaceae bacterium]